MPEVVSVFPNKINKLLTTRSWDFMGFSQQRARRTSLESDVIIGVFDSGIWPASESFGDDGLGPPPAKWKGSCQFPPNNFTCNNKIVGAKFYRTNNGTFSPADVRSPVDTNGHGTHVAATAAGSLGNSCYDGDILAAFDDAVADGVDLISVSLGADISRDHFEDPIAIGSFHAMKEGILTVDSAGNDGVQGLYTVRNFSPWSLSVAATAIDRQFFAQVRLGNNQTFQGIAINTFDIGNTMYPIIYGGDAPNISGNFSSSISRLCANNSLNPDLVRGKIVLCDSIVGALVPVLAGAVGSIVATDRPAGAPAENPPSPVSVLTRRQGSTILAYIRSTRNATATISKSNVWKDEQAPYIASFSSRGPNPAILDILKPDISAPGVNVLAAWPPNAPITPYPAETRTSRFNFQYGTSMACPHVTGAAAYVKSHHPQWSPAAVKSAIMTTALPMSPLTNPDAEFAYGSGHLNPLGAIDPGLVYDAGEPDYVRLLCGQGYNTTAVRMIARDNSSCWETGNGTVWDFNYPSFAVSATADEVVARVFNRVVTNVGGSGNASYRAVVESPEGVRVRVSPGVLGFRAVGERLRFVVTVEGAVAANSTVSGSLVWDDGVHKVYIAYMGNRPNSQASLPALHFGLLHRIIGSAKVASDSLIYSYHRTFNGFAARLTEAEHQKLSAYEGVVSVFPNKIAKLHTTRSWDFIRYPKNASKSTRRQQSNLIIGVLDTGIWPESPSFDDSGYGPPPKKWKGSCQSSSNFTCNNKIIGARYYNAEGDYGPGDIPSPRDSEGHGSHTASTAAGNFVTPANLYGIANGTARGGVPAARIAVYKICWAYGCSYVDIMKAFDDACSDGIDMVSLSVGGSPLEYFRDPIAIGAFHCMKKGILTSNSAGNSGPFPGSVSNNSPWSLTVAANTIDRKLTTNVMLGNGEIYNGSSLNTFVPNKPMYPLIYGGDAPNRTAGYDGNVSKYCYSGSLDRNLVQGKIVYCEVASQGDGPIEAGAAGAIMGNYPQGDVAFPFLLPVSLLNETDGSNVLTYSNSTSDPTAVIYKTVDYLDGSSPYVVYFSSRGYNPITPDILKPDVTGPGVNILAAWSQGTTMTGQPGDTRVVAYNIISGTSMSCPHATGAAAYVKSLHRTWSPAAIKSALMTTARPLSAKYNPEAELAYGTGQINPIKAADPGLVYDAREKDYVIFLCGLGYSTKQLRLVTGDPSACTAATNGTVWDLNYPSFALSANRSGVSVTRVFHRTVTNVGSANATYKATVTAPANLKVRVSPSVLSFKTIGKKKSFALKVSTVVGQNTISEMAAISIISRLLILSLLVLPFVVKLSSAANSEDVHGRKRFIVYMGGRPVNVAGELSVSSLHVSMIQRVVGSSNFSPDLLVKSFKRSFHGFVVKLTDNEAQKIAALTGVVSIFRDESYQLQTTRSWDFIGFPQNVERLALERDIIIGMLDTGIWPESESFNDTGLGPPPARWKGICQSSSNFTCNK
ncbi:unnamed protein product [Linum tenue]|uniref:Cucumisin n=1 Tax=Linum tenue TaxID=586396 RepID=A0AAV0MBR0_9ROSI|nr:unnamed protein product [Linum tenue]